MNDCQHKLSDRSYVGQCLACGETGLPARVTCPDCTYPHLDNEGCTNPWCLANPLLSEAARSSIIERREQYKQQQAEQAERQRLYALSFRR